MKSIPLRALTGFLSIGACGPLWAADAEVLVAHSAPDVGFAFEKILPPATNDAATQATFKLVAGEADANSGPLDVLHDGRIPRGGDDPRSNFFLKAGPEGGRLLVDLGSVISVKSLVTYSWHDGPRGPQVFRVYGSDGKSPGFKESPDKGADPLKSGWSNVATVDARPKSGDVGGQYAASVSGRGNALLGAYRYLLIDVASTNPQDRFAQTFFSELDVIDAKGPAPVRLQGIKRIMKSVKFANDKFTCTVDATIAPDLMEWTEKELLPVVEEWYPKMAAMLPSAGFQPPATIYLQYKDDMKGVPAYALGDRISLNAGWFRQNLKGESKGCVVHEMVHVVQNYWLADRVKDAKRAPGWVTEGIPDYIRWFLYEPQSRGAEVNARNVDRVHYNDSYRVTANFLDWVVTSKNKDLIQKLNAAAREGRYNEASWKEWTGMTLEELEAAWKKAKS